MASRLFILQLARGGGCSRVVVPIRAAHAEKTPVQKLGWQYLLKQQQLGRPLSPHLDIYKPQLTWLLSGAHRISGCVMSGTLFVGVLLFGFGPFSYTRLIERIRSWQLPAPVTASAKFLIAWTTLFHTLNGIRFMGFDLAKGMELPQIYRSGYLVLAASTLLALLIVANSKRITPPGQAQIGKEKEGRK